MESRCSRNTLRVSIVFWRIPGSTPSDVSGNSSARQSPTQKGLNLCFFYELVVDVLDEFAAVEKKAQRTPEAVEKVKQNQ